MQRFRANARFGPFRTGDEFESDDEFHLQVAESSGLLSVVGEAETSTETVDSTVDETVEDDTTTDGSSEEEEPQAQEPAPWLS